MALNRRSIQPIRRPSQRGSDSLERNRRDVIIGDSVSAMMAETVTAPTRVKANSVNSAPVRPPWNPIGT